MATLILPYPAFTAGTPAVAAEVQDNFTTIRDHINGQNIGTANIETTLVSRVGGPILFLNQASQEQIALSILNSRTKSALQITQSAVLGAGSSIIAIDDNATQTTGDAQLYINTQVGSTIPAIKVNHGSDVTMSLTKTQLDLFNSAVEVSAAHIKLPIRTTAQRDAVTQAGSILYNDTDKRVQYRDTIGWNDLTPAGVVQMYAGPTAPAGWLICDGSVISQSNYQALFAIIGSTYNTGSEGAGNFRIPDCRGIFVRGAGTKTTATYLFQIAVSSVTAGAVYSNNGQTFTVLRTIAGKSVLATTSTGNPTSSGTLTKVSGTGPATITFSSAAQETYSGILGQFQEDATAANGLSADDLGHQHGVRTPSAQPSSIGSDSAADENINLWPLRFTEIGYANIALTSLDAETRPANIALNYIIKT